MRFLFTFFTMLFFSLSLIGQDYTPILNHENEWHFTTCYFGCYSDKYYTDGDTLVNGKTYKILDGYHFISRTFLLREEVAEKKLYFLKIRPSGGIDEYLLYDFTLRVGDTINMQNPITPFPEEGGYFRLDSIIPRPLVDGQNYDYFYFSPTPSNPISTDNAIWVEGVGSLSLINAPGGFPDLNGVGALSCYFKGRDVFYANLDSIDDCTPLFMGVPESNLEKVIVSKLHGTQTFLLHNAQNITQLTLFSLNGKKLKTIHHNFTQTISLDLAGFDSGTYIVLTKGIGGSAKTFKIIK
ncbi:T9SS type A sorting domain-containing protein [Aequorivita sp. F47161]|uniref:T9SS type A sorting domain-containing protein n=1 Tax=Aequorivita vitellina TaxID=2874475 RepID=A0A9X1QYX3_9FLAO|nr:T9SS type A sorting domain-containing protein [Aequorivita vitellina]MCG2420369.1 T9SS type A sorting domain-containing protein [Aequorivita vitellina]